MNAKQASWIVFLSEYDFDIRHIKGKENNMIDTLSQSLKQIHEISIIQCETNLLEQVKGN